MAKPKEEKTQRSAPRLKVESPVSVKTEEAIEPVEGTTRDISVRGVFLYTKARVAEGSSLEIVLPLPDGLLPARDTWMRCKCRVVRVEKADQGDEFGVAASIEDYELLADGKFAEA